MIPEQEAALAEVLEVSDYKIMTKEIESAWYKDLKLGLMNPRWNNEIWVLNWKIPSSAFVSFLSIILQSK